MLHCTLEIIRFDSHEEIVILITEMGIWKCPFSGKSKFHLDQVWLKTWFYSFVHRLSGLKLRCSLKYFLLTGIQDRKQEFGASTWNKDLLWLSLGDLPLFLKYCGMGH